MILFNIGSTLGRSSGAASSQGWAPWSTGLYSGWASFSGPTEARLQGGNRRNTGSVQLQRTRLDALTDANESRQHRSDGASGRGRRADAAQPGSANLTDQGVGTLPHWLLIPLLKPKVTSPERNANLCPIPGNADSSPSSGG